MSLYSTPEYYSSLNPRVTTHSATTPSMATDLVTLDFTPKPDKDPTTSLGFIILRNVRDKDTGEYWKISYTCIRKFYPENHIIIIDDNSDYDYIDLEFQKKLYNAFIVRSDYPARGEILPYYYFLHYDLFSTACIIHDSVFINSRLNTQVEKYKFLLDFYCHTNEYKAQEKKMISVLDNNREIMNFYKKSNIWKGCFGVMTIITKKHLIEINNKHNIFSLLPLIKNRRARICFEMVFACILQYYDKVPTLFGDISNFCKWGITYSEIKKDIHNLSKINLPLIKIWSGR